MVCPWVHDNTPRWALSEHLCYFCGLVAVGTNSGHVFLVGNIWFYDQTSYVNAVCKCIPGSCACCLIIHTCDLSRSGIKLPMWRHPLRPPDEAAKISIFMNTDFSLLPKAKSCFPITEDACFISSPEPLGSLVSL